jgi:hypothetical protein
MYNREKFFFDAAPDAEEDEREKALALLKEKVYSSASAFAVFHTQPDRDKALEVRRTDDGKVETTSFEFDAAKYGYTDPITLEMAMAANEPANMNWHNFKISNRQVLGFFKGFFMVYMPALFIWFFGFYVPYAWSLYNFNYDNGAELPGYYSLIFTTTDDDGKNEAVVTRKFRTIIIVEVVE